MEFSEGRKHERIDLIMKQALQYVMVIAVVIASLTWMHQSNLRTKQAILDNKSSEYGVSQVNMKLWNVF